MKNWKDREVIHLIQSSITVFIIQISSAFLVFISNYVLIKTSGTPAYGTITYFSSFATLLAGISILGLDSFLLREVAASKKNNDYGRIKGLLMFTRILGIGASGVAMVILFVTFSSMGLWVNQNKISWLMLFSIPFLVFTNLNQSAIQALLKIRKSQTAEKIVRPVILMGVAWAWFSLQHHLLDSKQLSIIFFVSSFIPAVLSFWWLSTSLSPAVNKKSIFEWNEWWKAAVSFAVLNSFYLLQSRLDILFLGALKGNRQVAVFNIASRLPDLISFPLMVVNFTLSAKIASWNASRQIKQMQKFATEAARWALFGSLPIVLFLLLFHNPLLSLFGVEYRSGGNALIMMSCAQLANVLFGSVGMLLIMTGHEKQAAISVGFSILIHAVLNYLLIPQYEINGAAFGNVVSIIVWNVLMYYFVRKKLGISSTPFAFNKNEKA